MSSAAAKHHSFSPFVRVATIDAVFNDDGTVNEWDSYERGQEVGTAIKDYIADTDEAADLGFPSDWVVAGDAVSTVVHTENQSPSVHFAYSKQDGNPFSTTELAAIAATVTETLTYDDQEGVTVVVHEEELENILSTYDDGVKVKSSSWRAVRDRLQADQRRQRAAGILP